MTGGEGQAGRVAAAVMAEMEAMTWEQRMDACLAALDAWDRGCRELHEQHMAEIAAMRADFADYQRDRAEDYRMVAEWEAGDA